MPPPDNAQVRLYYSVLGRLQIYLAQNLTRYREHFLRLGRLGEYGAISEEAIQHMTLQPSCENGGEIIARVYILRDNYTRCKIPHNSEAAVITLMDWVWYLRDHSKNFTEENGAYEDFKRANAISAADDLWKAYQAYTADPLGWSNTRNADQDYRSYQERKSVDSGAYMAWLQQNQPERLPPAPPPFKLRANAEEWQPTTSEPVCTTVSNRSNTSLGQGMTTTLISSRGRQVHRSPPYDPLRATPLSVSLASSVSERSSEEDGYSSQDTSGTDNSVDDHIGSNSVRKIANASKVSTWPEIYRRKLRTNVLQAVSGTINQDILFFDAFRNYAPAASIKDCGNQGPSLVSEIIVRRLGREAEIETCRKNSYQPLQDISGNQLQVVGEIELDFMWWDRGAKDEYSIWHREVFVVAKMLDIQVLFGKDYLMNRGILTVNKPAMQRMIPALPLTPNLKINKGTYQTREIYTSAAYLVELR